MPNRPRPASLSKRRTATTIPAPDASLSAVEGIEGATGSHGGPTGATGFNPGYQVGVVDPATLARQSTEEYGRGGSMPSDSVARKAIPLATGFLDYWPDACPEVAKVSWYGNMKHNPGEPLHWARGKGGNNADEAMRHFLERGRIDESDPPGQRVRHMAKCVWRCMCILQLEIEAERKAAGATPLPPRTEVG